MAFAVYDVDVTAPALRAYVRTRAHGSSSARWVSAHLGLPVTHDFEARCWRHADLGDAARVRAALEELSLRILATRYEFREAKPLLAEGVRARMLCWRDVAPELCICSSPNVMRVDGCPVPLRVAVMAMPGDAYLFTEAAAEMEGLLRRFTVLVWRPRAGAPLPEARELERMHGVAVAERGADGDLTLSGSKEAVFTAVEAMGAAGNVVREPRPASPKPAPQKPAPPKPAPPNPARKRAPKPRPATAPRTVLVNTSRSNA